MSSPSVCKRCGHSLPSDAPQGQCPRCLLGGGEAVDTSWWQRGTAGSGHSFVPPKVEQLAEYFPQFEILELLGRGGMGAVYLARQRSLQRLVAVKILPPEIAATPGFEERFVREGQALAKLNHPGIVGVYDFGKTGPFAYLVLEYIEGVSLRTLLRDGHLPPAEALHVVPQLCDALQAAHARGIVHRDIKPENILLTTEGRVKIADFGVAKLVQPDTPSTTRSGGVVGTFQYMAPEQLERPGEVDHRADIYSLGVVFYEMLTGGLPLGRFPSPSQCSDVNPGLDRIVLRALEKRPEMRYPSAVDVRTDVDSLRTERPYKPDSSQHAASRTEPQGDAVATNLVRRARNLAASGLHHGAPLARRAIGWIGERVGAALRWVRRLPASLLLAASAMGVMFLGVLMMANSHPGSPASLNLLIGVSVGVILLRLALARLDDHPTRAERILIIYPLRCIVALFCLALVAWPLMIGVALSAVWLDQWPGRTPLWLDSVHEVIVMATGATLLAIGLNTALLTLVGIFFPSFVAGAVRPYSIHLGKVVPLLFLCGAVAVGTLGGMMVYSVTRPAFGRISTSPSVPKDPTVFQVMR